MFYLKDGTFERRRAEKFFVDPPLARGAFYSLSNKNDKMVCRCCGQQRIDIEFFATPESEIGARDRLGHLKSTWCCYCLPKAIEILTEMNGGDQYKALYKMCSQQGWYYDDELAHKIIPETEFYWDKSKERVPDYVPWVYVYISETLNNPKYKNKGFSNTENFAFEEVVKYQRSGDGQMERMSEKDKKNRMKVMSIYHWDPFEEESLEDKPKLYEDLITMSTEGISEDLPKARAAIEIVRGYLRVDKINKALIQMQASIDSMLDNEKSIKALTEQKKSELAAISTLAKENGFSEIANKMKSKGIGTLTGIVREMNDAGFDRGTVNRFDIDTTEAMRKVAEISAESMFKQLGWTSSDYADMVREQAKKIRKMQQTMAAQAEELRLLKEEHLRQELIERYEMALIDKEINPEETARLVEEELKYVPAIEYRNKVSADQPNSEETKTEE